MTPDVIDIYAPDASPADLVRRAAALLDAGEVVVLPTETVYGAAARLDRPDAVAKLRSLRGDAASGPFTIHLASAEGVEAYVGPGLTSLGRRMTQKLWPGPVALVFDVAADARAAIAGRLGLAESDLFAADGTITLRCPAHPLAIEVLAAVDGPVALSRVETRSGEQPFGDPLLTAALDGVASLVLDAGRTRFAKPSTIVRVEGDRYRVVREGVFDERIIERQLKTIVVFVCSGNTCRSPMAGGIAGKLLRERYGARDDLELETAGINVVSAGTFAMPGLKATPQAVEAAADFGVDLAGHRSRPLTPELIHAADFIFTMGRAHAQAIASLAPSAASRVLPLDPDGDVDDPIGGDLSLYRSLAERFRSLIANRLDQTVLKLHPPAGGSEVGGSAASGLATPSSSSDSSSEVAQ